MSPKHFVLTPPSDEIVMENAGAFLAASATPVNELKHIVLDLRNVKHVDSSGVGAVIKIINQLRDLRPRRILLLLGPPRGLAHRRFILTGIADYAPIVQTEEEALLRIQTFERISEYWTGFKWVRVLPRLRSLAHENADLVSNRLRNLAKFRADVVMDLKRLRYVDAVGLGALIDGARHVREQVPAGLFLTVNGQPVIRNKIVKSGLVKILGLADSLAEACERIQAKR